MFKRKCSRCNRKVEKDFLFCPYCAYDFRLEKREREEKDYGFLGRDDFGMPEPRMNLPFGFNRIFNSLVKELDKQFRNMDKDDFDMKKNGIRINISTGFGKPAIKINELGNRKQEKEIKKVSLSKEKARKLLELPKQEAETSVRRLSNKLVYEISVPGVKNIRDVLINKLESSVEIKAIAKYRIFVKLLPINLPLINYKLKQEKLILEFKS